MQTFIGNWLTFLHIRVPLHLKTQPTLLQLEYTNWEVEKISEKWELKGNMEGRDQCWGKQSTREQPMLNLQMVASLIFDISELASIADIT